MKIITALVLTAFLYAPSAWSQCTGGIDTGGGNCTPPDAPGMPGSEGNIDQQQPSQSRPVWANRWGAIASDSETGAMGTAEGRKSKAEAQEVAMSFCQSRGDKNCEVIFNFYNQCAAAVWGAGKLYVSGAATEEQAERHAFNHCDDASCKIVYSKCSYAERIR